MAVSLRNIFELVNSLKGSWDPQGILGPHFKKHCYREIELRFRLVLFNDFQGLSKVCGGVFMFAFTQMH